MPAPAACPNLVYVVTNIANGLDKEPVPEPVLIDIIADGFKTWIPTKSHVKNSEPTRTEPHHPSRVKN